MTNWTTDGSPNRGRDSGEPLDGPAPNDGNANSAKQGGSESHDRDRFSRPLSGGAINVPPEIAVSLLNWQVSEPSHLPSTKTMPTARYVDDDFFNDISVEIEGEVTVVEEKGQETDPTEAVTTDVDDRENGQPSSALDAVDATETRTITDHLDPAIVITLAERQCTIHPGEEATYRLTVLNNSKATADFRITVEGWLDESWLTEPIPQLTLAPGEWHLVDITLRPERQSTSRAGIYPLAIIVREYGKSAATYGQRMSRLRAELTILPMTRIRAGRIQPSPAELSWGKQRTRLTWPIHNQSNHSITLRLQTRQETSFYRCALCVPNRLSTHKSPSAKRLPLPTTIQLDAGEQRQLCVDVTMHHHPTFGLHETRGTLHLLASQLTTTQPQNTTPISTPQPWTQSTSVAIRTRPRFGVWHLTGVVGFFTVLIISLGIAAMASLLVVGLSARQAKPAPQPILQPAAAQPVIIAYIQAPVNSQPAPNTQPIITQPIITQPQAEPEQSVGAVTTAPLPDVVVVTDPAQVTAPGAPPQTIANGVPAQVRPDQITSPQGSAIAQRASAPDISVPAPATPAPMTYATMFREISYNHNLDWRVLAAQAYVESGFDTVALGKHGDLGLMQIMPSTWHEWAPSLNVTDPFDSYSNVLVAATYLNYLQDQLSKRGQSDIEWTLVAYNWGIDKVLRHIESGQGWQDLDATRQQYAMEILRLAETIPENN